MKAVGKTVIVELKNGNVYVGTLETCDMLMNIQLKDSELTQHDGKKYTVKTVVVRGVNVKSFQVEKSLFKNN